MEHGAAKSTELIALDTEACVYERAFGDGILLMMFASPQIADAHRLRSPDVNADSGRGALLVSKTKKPHCQDWPWGAWSRALQVPRTACDLSAIYGPPT